MWLIGAAEIYKGCLQQMENKGEEEEEKEEWELQEEE